MIQMMGEKGRGGVYVLRMAVARAVAVRFGRFRQGTPIPVPAGSYLYVGSAMAQQGGSSLARRLLRHTTRADGCAHPIRPELLAASRAADLLDAHAQPPQGKKLHWHVDYLLDEAAVTVTAVFAIRTPQRLESPLARWLLADGGTAVLVPGLGARDAAGETHLLRVPDPDWWREFPARLQNFLYNGEAVRG